MIAFERVTFYGKQKDENGVRHVFPVDSTASHDTAKSWATHIPVRFENGKRVYGEEIPAEVFEFENKGFDNVRIVDLYHRGNGGRAYQIVIEVNEDKFQIDMREDTMLELIRRVGIQAGGRLNGTYCFAKSGSETKLILEGYKTHKRAIEEFSKRTNNSKVIKKADLKVGYQYETISGDSSIFLGHVYVNDLKDNVLGKPYKAMLWLRKYYLKELKDNIDKENLEFDDELTRNFSWGINVLKTHSFKVEKGNVFDSFDIDLAIKNINKAGELSYNAQMLKEWNGFNDARWDIETAHDDLKMKTVKKNKEDLDLKEETLKEIKEKAKEAIRRRDNNWRRW